VVVGSRDSQLEKGGNVTPHFRTSDSDDSIFLMVYLELIMFNNFCLFSFPLEVCMFIVCVCELLW
jgi:hypothetical protein